MVILDNYIGRSVLGGVLAVVTVVTILFVLISFAGEFSDIGKANYTYANALAYVLLRTPRHVYELFPIAAVLGTIIGLGTLAGRSELVVVRASGISIPRLVWTVLRASLLLVLAAFLIGEVIAPPAEQYAQQMRLKALERKISLNTSYGLWIRDGENFVHVQQMTDKRHLRGIFIYNFDRQQRLKSITHARTAELDDEAGWILSDVERSNLANVAALAPGDTRPQVAVTTEQLDELRGFPLLPVDVIDTVSVAPQTLSVWRLGDYIDYLLDNGLNADNYELAFWTKVMMPFSIAAMVLLAVPFVAGSMRATSIGQRILLGFMLGIVFFLLNKLAGQMGIVYDFPPALAASAPTLIVLVGVSLLLRRVP
ncbi:MAG TPA: LPS export ABC transporter permease LptG [Gammaproteobacteria bacterium]|nr:LPS export ABC transporter permease LptG [Gammaproteobacteria bacterium]